ncbi:antibiotic biosynthesis monooxygenase family protein [Actibacterium sp. D379-3]
MTPLCPLPAPPYYAVIFASLHGDDIVGYDAMADRMAALAAVQPGYLGADSARTPGSTGITVSYWADEAALLAWKAVAEHALAQKLGKDRWYRHYTLRVARVERQYDGPEGR